MWSAWFDRLKDEIVTFTSVEAIESKSARQIAYANERLQNNALVLAHSSGEPLTDHDSAQAGSLGVTRRSCGAH